MYNHKKQLLLSFAIGLVVGAGGMRHLINNNYLRTNDQILRTNDQVIKRTVPVNWYDFTPLDSKEADNTNDSQPINNEQLCELQEYLSIIETHKGTVDGISGKDTIASIKEAQKQLHIPITGTASFGLLAKLKISASNKISENEFNQFKNTTYPLSGTILDPTTKNSIAPLEIRTMKKSGDYVVKLQNKVTGNEELMFFVRGGTPTKVEVPLGRYILKYANGSGWYSKRCLFGVNTKYNKSDEILNFTSSGQRVAGYTVELILQRNGNLNTRRINKQDW